MKYRVIEIVYTDGLISITTYKKPHTKKELLYYRKNILAIDDDIARISFYENPTDIEEEFISKEEK